MSEILTEAEFSKLVRLSRTRLWELRKKGVLQHCRSGAKILYKREFADQLMESLEHSAKDQEDPGWNQNGRLAA